MECGTLPYKGIENGDAVQKRLPDPPAQSDGRRALADAARDQSAKVRYQHLSGHSLSGPSKAMAELPHKYPSK